MGNRRLSLMDVLQPPVNPWLDELSKHNAKVPAGVRIVRLSDDDGDNREYQSPSPPPQLTSVPTKQAA